MATTAKKPASPDVEPDEDGQIVDPIGDTKYPVEGAVYDVYHLDPSKGHRIFYGRLESEDVQEAFFASRWGGGRYTIQKKVRNEEGHQKIAKAVTWVIEGEHKGSALGAPVPEGGEGAPSTQAGTPSDLVQMGIMDVFQAQRDGAEMQRTMMMEYLKMNQVLMAKMAEPGLDWKVLVPLIVPLVERMLDGKKGEPSSLEIAKQLTELASANKDDTPMDKMLEIFKQVLEVKDMVTDDAAPVTPTDPLTMFAAQVAPEVVKTLQKSREHDYPEKGAKAPTAEAPALPPPDPNDMTPEWAKALRAHLPSLVSLAQAGRGADGYWNRDPTVYADVLLDQLESDPQEALRVALTDPTFLDSLAAQLPAIQQNRIWFEELIQHLRFRLTPDEAESSTEETVEEEEPKSIVAIGSDFKTEPAPEGDDT
ncbi:MAG: hypothetical protein GY906_38700 [bacterium]|nr:hypothetical protein [bacterium]